MSGNVADLEVRQTRIGSPVARRPGVIADRRDTRVPELQGFARMGSASRGDGGAEELMRTLGVVSKAAGSFQEYAERDYAHKEEANAARGAVDQAAGHIDQELEQRSGAYRRAIELGREQTGFASAVEGYGRELTGIVEHQTSPDLKTRLAEVDQHIDEFFRGYALDPETGNIRTDLTTAGAQRWLGEEMRRTRARVAAAAHARIEERFTSEGLTHAGTLFSAQLDTGSVDIAALRAVLPPTANDDELRRTLLTTIQSKAEQLKSSGRGADAMRLLNALLAEHATANGGAVRTVDVPPSNVGNAPSGSDGAVAAPQRPSVTTRRTKDRVVGFVLNTLEGGAQIVDNGDGGGTTKFGITKRHNPDVDIGSLTFGQASKIAKDRYWQPVYDDANPAVAAIAFDAGFINSKSFGREIATKFANDPVGALDAYRSRLQDIAKKPDKARFLRAWMNRVDRLGTYLGVGPDGSGSDNVIDDPTFSLDPEPLDPVEEARRNPGPSLAGQMVGGLALRPEERTRLLEYRDQLGREVRQEWTRERREKQDEAHAGFMLRLSGLGAPTTPSEISAATRDGTLRAEDAVQLLNVIRQDADRDEQRAERAAAVADRNRDKAEERQAEGIVASLMGPVYSGTRAPGEALRLFGTQAAGINPRVRRAVLGAINAEVNGVEALRKSNPDFVSAVDRLDDQEQQALSLIREPYRDPKTGRIMTAESRREFVRLEFAKAKRTLVRQAIDTGNVGTLPAKLDVDLARKVRPYHVRRTRGKPEDAPPSLSEVAQYYWSR